MLTTNAAPLLTVAGVARWLSVSTATVYALVKAGDIPHQRLPRGGIRFDGDQVERWLVAREVGGKST